MKGIVYVIKTSDGHYFAGTYNHFLEPRFEPHFVGAKLYEDQAVATMVLERMKRVLKGNELETHFPNIKVAPVGITLDK